LNNDPLLDRWMGLWRRLGAPAPELGRSGCDVIAAYEGAGRFYHTRQHLEDVLQKIDWAKTALEAAGDLADIPAQERPLLFDTVEMALWYHDAVYDARGHDNEMKSRCVFLADAEKNGLPGHIQRDVARLIDVTAKHGNARRLDERILCDCDLAILGAPTEQFDAYDSGIRKEYAHVPAREYEKARRRVLRGFLRQGNVFKTKAFQQEFGARARWNLLRRSMPVRAWLYSLFCRPPA
jgi:predicted metal-dependent HD superfamily phosphohydrolase